VTLTVFFDVENEIGIGVRWTLDTIAWDFPYWLIFLVWALTFAKFNGLKRLALRQVFVATTGLGVALDLVASPASLPLVVLLNLMTVAWFVVVIYVGLSKLVRTPWLDGPTPFLPHVFRPNSFFTDFPPKANS
jgi:hypothetical protein